MVPLNPGECLPYKPSSSCNLSSVESLKPLSIYIDHYSFFGVDFEVNFDSLDIQENYRNRYKYFRINPSDRSNNHNDAYYIISKNPIYNKPLLLVNSKRACNLIEIFSKGKNRKRFKMNRVDYNGHTYYDVTDCVLNNKTAMVIDNNASIILDEELLSSYTELIVFNSILSQIPNHFILHAGAVSWKDKGIILCGEMNSGKSTLTISLVQNGFKFLSDEIAFIDLESFEVAPFPRALGFREDTISKLPELNVLKGQENAMSLGGDMKWALDVESISPNSLGKRCKIGCLIILDGFGDAPELKPISRADAIFESLKYTHTLEDDLFGHILKVADLFNDNDIVCCKLVLGDREDNLRVLNQLLGEIF